MSRLAVLTVLMISLFCLSESQLGHFRKKDTCECVNLFGCLFRGGKTERPCSLFGFCCDFQKSPRILNPPSNTKSGRSLFHNPSSENGLHKSPYQCGISHNAQRKIMGGLDAGYGQFPWTALVKVKGRTFDVNKHCGGTLLNSRWVITAGHCTSYCEEDPSGDNSEGVLFQGCYREIPQSDLAYEVLLGAYNQFEDADDPSNVYNVNRVFRHPNYRNVIRVHENGFLESEPRYDVALLLLNREVFLHENVAPICLPPFASSSFPSNHNLGTVVGWGRTGMSEKSAHSSILQAVTVPMLDKKDCGFLTGLETFPDQLCAGGANSSEAACPGDSGGGLQQQNDLGHWVLVGIVSNGPSVCGVQPVIFHKVSHTIEWIRNVVRKDPRIFP